jgi:GAF domain-containing protein
MTLPTRLPADFVDRLRDLLSTVNAEQIMLRPALDDERLDRIVRLAMKQTGAEAGLMLLLSDDRGDLRIAAAVGPKVTGLRGEWLARTGLAGFALDDGNPIAVADVAGSPQRGRDELEERCGLVTKSLLAVPVVVHGRAGGVIELVNAPGKHGFTPDDVALVTELALLAAAAIEEFRGDRFLLSLFQGALPRALDPERGESADSLAAELERWLGELRQTPAWRTELELVALVRELCAAGPDAVDAAKRVLEALVDRERARRHELHE